LKFTYSIVEPFSSVQVTWANGKFIKHEL